MTIILITALGLVLGSFVNAFVWRLHEQETLLIKKKLSKSDKKQLNKLSIMHGRSMCPDCHHELAAKDLVPVFSWLSLGGKCRYCKKMISWQYPLVELLTAGLFAFSYLFWPVALHDAGLVQFGFWLVFVIAFMSLAVYDLRWMLLPNRLVFPLIGLAVVQVVIIAALNHDIWQCVDPLIGAGVISGLFYVLFQVSGGNWIGGGDVKLAVVLGLLAGTPIQALLVLFLSSVVGTIVSLPMVAQAKKGLKLRVPYGPFLLVATVIVVLFGTSIVNWYDRLLL